MTTLAPSLGRCGKENPMTKKTDFTQTKYHVEPDNLNLSPAEEQDWMEMMASIGIKPEDMVDKDTRKKYETYLRGRKAK